MTFNANKAFNFCALIALGSSCLSALNVSATELDLRISDDAVHVNGSSSKENTDIMFGGGYFYKDDDNDSHSISIANIDLHAIGRTAISNLPTTVGLGVQLNHADQGNFNATAIGIGGLVSINLPDTPGLSIETQLHYAPKVLAFQDADSFSRAHLQINYRVIKSADISIGYRYLNTGVENADDHTFESGAYLGFRLIF